MRHVFTHFALTLAVYRAHLPVVPDAALAGRFLRDRDALAGEALPTLMRKGLAAVWPDGAA